eukprot:Skav206898  [mRNA]  locus=scaffold2387:313016:320238:- [translate_table: standard]
MARSASSYSTSSCKTWSAALRTSSERSARRPATASRISLSGKASCPRETTEAKRTAGTSSIKDFATAEETKLSPRLATSPNARTDATRTCH